MVQDLCIPDHFYSDSFSELFINLKPEDPRSACYPPRRTSTLRSLSLSYLITPCTFSSANIIELAAGLTERVKIFGPGSPIHTTFHSLNGLLHLARDTRMSLPCRAPIACGRKILKLVPVF
ncbi:hypothetical protein EDB86DRAFT_2253681 [Lactarius hatsudake]|nr:hypothetical protein EDB86DRAFT_2253681 [Lactarius hatsudake]